LHPFARGTLACAVVLSYSVHSRGARTQPEGGAGGSKHWEIPQLRSVRRRKFNLFFGASGESLTVEGVPKVSINAGRDPPALQNVLPQGWFFGFSSAFFYFFFWPSTFFFFFWCDFHILSQKTNPGTRGRKQPCAPCRRPQKTKTKETLFSPPKSLRMLPNSTLKH